MRVPSCDVPPGRDASASAGGAFFSAWRSGRLPAPLSVATRVASAAWIHTMLPIARRGWRRRRATRTEFPSAIARTDDGKLTSSLCTQEQHASSEFRAWAARMAEPHVMHRKQWELCFIAQALHERGVLKPGARGLGFAVGQEPLPSLFASYGCSIVASDMAEDAAREAGWVTTGQHSASLDALNTRGLCPDDKFRALTRFRVVDMNHIPHDLQGFDFCWSACALEHLGSIEHGERFILNAMDCLRPGGIAVHTTEFNLSFEAYTPNSGAIVAFRPCDIERIAEALRAQGHDIALDLREGNLPHDRIVEVPPYPRTHLKLLLFSGLRGCIATSIALIVQKGK
jgi:2-polyprenyl-3-methyl-5-hydroxy-6-metoxy-1,4-benzoquinol methylase